jgi:hypothetical protein
MGGKVRWSVFVEDIYIGFQKKIIRNVEVVGR